MSEERVTTGSEPRRTWELEGYPPYDGFFHRVAGPTLGASERVKVVEVVESGHDEQTEDEHTRLDRAMGLLDDVADDAAEGRLDRRNCEEDAQRMAAIFCGPWQPDPRTVAAVVEALRGRLQELEDSGRAPASVVGTTRGLIAFIQERFKPSAPGGDDAGG